MPRNQRSYPEPVDPTAVPAEMWSVELHDIGLHVEAEGTRDEIAAKLIELGTRLLPVKR